MNRRIVGAAIGATAATVAFASPSAVAVPPANPEQATTVAASATSRPDNLPNPRAEAQAQLRQDAVTKLLQGKATTKTINGKRVIEVQGKQAGDNKNKGSKGKKGKYVEYDVNQTASIFTVLVQFGDQAKSPQGGTAGPQAGSIAQPDRTQDNSTYWEPKFDRQHYLDMMFGDGESFKNFYKSQSQGRFDVEGDVSDWVTVPYNEARYGHNPVAGDGTTEAGGYWSFIQDSVNSWYTAQKKAGKTDAEIKTYLAQFDQWDRYDYNNNGNFNEPDGYIDHFQAIHAGEGEEAGGGAQGEDAIWSHRWAVQAGYGTTGPASNKSGGAQIGTTGLWVGDYTTEPENGGLGVFSHEFGHDLGLPDLYDTTNRSTNSTSFWTLMSSGSWLNHGKNDIGTTPGYMGAWEKTQLGWADVKTVPYGAKSTQVVATGPADADDSKLPQAVAVTLPDKTVTTSYNTPKTGSQEWWSGRGDNLTTSLTRDLDLTSASTASVSAALAYDIEHDYDFLYAQVSTDGGSTWTDVAAPKTGTNMTWSTASYDLSAYKGKKVKFRWLYVTDGGVNQGGAFLDDIATTIDGTTTSDGAESTTSDWTAAGFTRMNGSTSKQVPQYYLAEYRRYAGYDKTLQTGPYNFGWNPAPKPDWVEHFPYQDGLLITFVNGEYEDNNTYLHPGGGLVLPVDAHSVPLKWSDGALMSNRIQPFDATFGTQATDAFTLHRAGVPTSVPSQAPVSVFDDSDANAYYTTDNKYGSTKVAGSGTKITVLNQLANSMQLKIQFKN
ncbi:immune inhibitor A domain-containing protein [Calidifontibacter terrae]